MRCSIFLLFAFVLIGCPGRQPNSPPDADDSGRSDARDESDANAAIDASDGASDADDGATDAIDAPIDVPQPTYETVQGIFDHSCAIAMACHSEGNLTHLRLDRGFAMAETINVPSFELPRMNRITPGDTDASYLYLKLQDSTLHSIPECMTSEFPPPCGTKMPAMPFTPLTTTDIGLIRRWIDDGAAH